MIRKSEDADIFWESIGPRGRDRYAPEYVDVRWPDIPKPVRREISRAMNWSQGRVNRLLPNATRTRGQYSLDALRQAEIERFRWMTEARVAEAIPRTWRIVKRQMKQMERYYERVEEHAAKIVNADAKIPKAAMRRRVVGIMARQDFRPIMLNAVKEGGEITNTNMYEGIVNRLARRVRRKYEAEYEKITKMYEAVEKGSKLNTLIFGMVAGAGGVIAGGMLRKLLMQRGVKNPSRAIDNAMATAYKMHNRRSTLVFKGKYYEIQYSNEVLKDGIMENDEHIRAGEQIIYQNKEGVVTSVSGNYVSIWSDGKQVLGTLDQVLRKSDAIEVDGSYLHWDEMSSKERARHKGVRLDKSWGQLTNVEKAAIQGRQNLISNAVGRLA